MNETQRIPHEYEIHVEPQLTPREQKTVPARIMEVRGSDTQIGFVELHIEGVREPISYPAKHNDAVRARAVELFNDQNLTDQERVAELQSHIDTLELGALDATTSEHIQ